MGTKARLRFLNRVARFGEDFEFVDVIYDNVLAGAMRGNGNLLFDGVDADRHPRLSGQKPSDNNRRDVAGHLRRTVYCSYIKDLYEDFADYLVQLVAATRDGFDPARVRTEQKLTMSAQDLLGCASVEDVHGLVRDALYERFELMSNTRRIVELLDDVLNLGLDRATVQAAQPYIELRHLLVHADGVASQEFCDAFPDFKAYVGQTIRVDAGTVSDAQARITQVVEEIDRKAMEARVVLAGALQ